MGDSLWCHKKSDTSEHASTNIALKRFQQRALTLKKSVLCAPTLEGMPVGEAAPLRRGHFLMGWLQGGLQPMAFGRNKCFRPEQGRGGPSHITASTTVHPLPRQALSFRESFLLEGDLAG